MTELVAGRLAAGEQHPTWGGASGHILQSWMGRVPRDAKFKQNQRVNKHGHSIQQGAR